MNVLLLSDFLLWCGVINYGILVGWFVCFTCAHQWLFDLHRRWFSLTMAQFDALHYLCMALYKLGVLLLNVVPYIALRLLQ